MWLVLHGLPGCGKTSLAIDSVRRLHAEDNVRLFGDGVFWLHVGQSECVQYSLVGQLYAQIRQQYPGHLPDEHDNELQRCQIELHFKWKPKSLIVLDDVWKETDLLLFRLGVPVLVTTRNRAVAPEETLPVKFVAVDDQDGQNALQWAETKLLLSKCLQQEGINVDEDELETNVDVRRVMDRVNHLPYLVAQVALVVAHHGWRHLANSLYECADMRATVDRLLRASVEALRSDERQILSHFELFFGPVTVDVLATLTRNGLPKFKLHLCLHRLNCKSLLRISKTKVGPWLAYPIKLKQCYSVHDLTRDYLRHQRPPSELTSGHAQLVEAYLQGHCADGNLARLPHDGYIQSHLKSHLVESGLDDLLVKFYLDLDFLQVNTGCVGKSVILSALALIQSRCVSDQDRQRVQEYERFVRNHSWDDPRDWSQLALLKPTTSCLFQDAIQLTDKQFFFESTNLDKTELDNHLDTRFQVEEFSDSVYLPKWDVVVTGYYETLSFWSTKTTARLGEYRVGEFTHFVISQHGTHILTFGYITARLFGLQANAGSVRLTPLLKKYDEDSDIISAAISDNGQLVVLGLRDGQLRGYSLDDRLLGPFEPLTDCGDEVTCCCFSRDSQFVLRGNSLYSSSILRLYSLHPKTFEAHLKCQWNWDDFIDQAVIVDSHSSMSVLALTDRGLFAF